MIQKHHQILSANYNQPIIKLILPILFFFLTTVAFVSAKAATIYIDPGYTGSSQSGTIDRPFNSWTKVSFSNGNTYLQKRGTTYTSASRIALFTKSGITIGAYGTGNRPKIITSGTGDHIIYIKDSYNVTVRDLEITSTGSWVSGITVQGGSSSSGNKVINCHIHKATWGIRILTPAGGTAILNTQINNIGDDGIFAQDVGSIEIGYCNIFDINKKYLTNTSESYAAGDGIQITSTNNLNFNIHNNTIDHSTMGNKACIMIWGNNYTGTIEFNTIIGSVAKNVAGIYLHNSSKPVTVRYNTIRNSGVGLVSNITNVDAFYNIFSANRVGVMVNQGFKANLRNNVFYNNTRYAIQTATNSNITLRNNIFNLAASPAKALFSQGAVTSNNNLFSQQYSGFINGHSQLSTWRQSTGNDINSLVGNPGFVGASTGNFHINSTSIAKNKGAIVNLTRDYFGNPVPNSGIPDIGIHEYGGTKTEEVEFVTDSIQLVAAKPVIYPNPSVDGNFTLKFDGQKDIVNFDVFDVAGNHIKSSNTTSVTETPINLSMLPPGTYIVRVHADGETYSLKAMK